MLIKSGMRLASGELVQPKGVPAAGLLEPTNPLNEFFDRLCHFNSEVMVLGIDEGADANERLAAELGQFATSIGFMRIAHLIERLQNEWIRCKNDCRHDSSNAIQLAHQLMLIRRMVFPSRSRQIL